VSRGPLEQVSRWLATGFGAGFLWPAPGTWGSLLGAVLFILLLAPLAWGWQLAAGVALTILGTVAAEVAAPGLGGDDPSAVVVDEWAAMWLSMVAIGTPLGWAMAFFLFRIFDIIKPFPGRRFEALHGGVGIMADDVVAALYTQVTVRLIFLAGAGAGIGLFTGATGQP
jgi:phosphatidylglycerophosphatase A